jgi:molybdenum cofactor cytidylyltransferase
MLVSAILLGAGESKRMGENKLLLPWGKTTVFQHCLEAHLRSKAKEVIVVLSARTKRAVGEVKGNKVKVIVNPHYKKGISTSIRKGIGAISRGSQGILIALSDQPLLKTRTIDALIHAFERKGGDIIAPSFLGRKGHPVIFHIKFKKDLLKLQGDTGARSILRKYPESVRMVRVRSEGILKDIDSWEDYRYELRVKNAEQAPHND